MNQINHVLEQFLKGILKATPLAIAAACLTLENEAAFAQQWDIVLPMFSPVYRGGAASGPDGKVYVVGGYSYLSQKPVASVQRYNPNPANPNLAGWEYVPPLNRGRQDHATVTGCDGKIYAIGGRDGNYAVTTTVEAYDPSANSAAWTYQPSLRPTTHNRWVAAVGPNCGIYAISSDLTPTEVQVLAGGMWTVFGADPFNGASIWGAVSTHDGHVYALSAGNVYDFDGNTWSKLLVWPFTMGQPQAGFPGPGVMQFSSTLGVDGNIYALGGGPSPLAAVTVLSPSARASAQAPAMDFKNVEWDGRNS